MSKVIKKHILNVKIMIIDVGYCRLCQKSEGKLNYYSHTS